MVGTVGVEVVVVVGTTSPVVVGLMAVELLAS